MKTNGRRALLIGMLGAVLMTTAGCGPGTGEAFGQLYLEFLGGVLGLGIGIVAILIALGGGGK